MARLSFRCDDYLVQLVDQARGEVARERWLRKAVERAAAAEAVDWAGFPIVSDERMPRGKLIAATPICEGDSLVVDRDGKVRPR